MPDEQAGPGLFIKIGLNVDGVLSGVGGIAVALNQSLELFSKFERAAQTIVDLANKAGAFGKEIKDNARDLGLSTTEFQQWRHAAIAAGTSSDEFTASVRLFSVRMKDAGDETSEVGKLLKDMGVQVVGTDGKMRSMNSILKDVFPALNNLKTGFDRNQASMTLFGRGFSNISDLAELTREDIQKLIDQAPVLSEEKIESLDQYDVRMKLLNEKIGLLYVTLGEQLIPLLEDSLIPALEGAMPAIKDMIKLMDLLAEAVDRAATGYAMLANPGDWERINSAFMGRQATREWSREWGGELGTPQPNAPTYTTGAAMGTAQINTNYTAGKQVYLTIYQTNTGVISETELNKTAGKVIATGSALP